MDSGPCCVWYFRSDQRYSLSKRSSHTKGFSICLSSAVIKLGIPFRRSRRGYCSQTRAFSATVVYPPCQVQHGVGAPFSNALIQRVLKVDFQGSRGTSDGGLLLVRELDEAIGLIKQQDRPFACHDPRAPVFMAQKSWFENSCFLWAARV